MSHVVTASDETKKKRIHSNEFVSVCFGLKFVLVVKKRENAKRNPVLSAWRHFMSSFHKTYSRSAACWLIPFIAGANEIKTNSSLSSSWMSKHIQSNLNFFQFQLVVSNGSTFTKTRQNKSTSRCQFWKTSRKLQNVHIHHNQVKLAVDGQVWPNFQNVPLKSNMFADVSSVPWRPKTPPFAPNSLLKASNISKFLQWSQNDQILPNCQQSRQKHLVSSRNFSFLWKMPFRLLKVKRGAMCGTSSGIYPFTKTSHIGASWIPMLHAARISLKRMQWAILHLFQRVWERCDSTIQKNSCKNHRSQTCQTHWVCGFIWSCKCIGMSAQSPSGVFVFATLPRALCRDSQKFSGVGRKHSFFSLHYRTDTNENWIHGQMLKLPSKMWLSKRG